MENRRAYKSYAAAEDVVSKKRNYDAMQSLLNKDTNRALIDVAYYNCTLADPLLKAWPKMKMIGIIRDCEQFVRSASCISGEDPLPVGWPEPDKPLTPREKFIGMGRIRPTKDSLDGKKWPVWGAIERNIWLWRESNLFLLNAKQNFGKRVKLIRFDQLAESPLEFWQNLIEFLEISATDKLINEIIQGRGGKNKKPGGYQVPSSQLWASSQLKLLKDSISEINSLWEKVDEQFGE